MKPADVVRLPPVFARGFDQHPEDARVLPARRLASSRLMVPSTLLRASYCGSTRLATRSPAKAPDARQALLERPVQYQDVVASRTAGRPVSPEPGKVGNGGAAPRLSTRVVDKGGTDESASAGDEYANYQLSPVRR
jgi:hypothetical protein